jgi:hypothetical protein
MRQLGGAAQPQVAGAGAQAPRAMLPHEQRMTTGVPAPGVPPHTG